MGRKKNWRKAVQGAMKESADKEAKARYGSKRPTFNYRWEHVQAVVSVAVKLAEETGADVDVIECAAWLHDVCKQSHKQKHPEAGAAFARKLLPKTTFPKKKIEAVAKAIEDHMGLWRDKPLKNLESQVLWDADKLTKIGLTSIIHLNGMLLQKGRPRSTQNLIDNFQSQDWRERTVKSMHTKPGKRAAKKRLQALEGFLAGLQGEINGDDLVKRKKK